MEIHRMQRLNSQRAIPSTAVLFEALALQMGAGVACAPKNVVSLVHPKRAMFLGA